VNRTAVATFALISAALHAHAADWSPQISVTGTAEVLVVPDEVTLSLGITVVDLDISKSRAECDVRARRVLEITKKHGVNETDVRTDQIKIAMKNEKRLKDGAERWEFIGFETSQSLLVKLREVSKYESLLAELLTAGITDLNNVVFGTSRLHELRQRVRIEALKQAREKAREMAHALDVTIGRVNSITEGYENSGISGLNIVQSLQGPEVPDATKPALALGQVSVAASVNVSFELEQPAKSRNGSIAAVNSDEQGIQQIRFAGRSCASNEPNAKFPPKNPHASNTALRYSAAA
jgi:uncharacterized protein